MEQLIRHIQDNLPPKYARLSTAEREILAIALGVRLLGESREKVESNLRAVSKSNRQLEGADRIPALVEEAFDLPLDEIEARLSAPLGAFVEICRIGREAAQCALN
jgi:hypothetical protein